MRSQSPTNDRLEDIVEIRVVKCLARDLPGCAVRLDEDLEHNALVA